MSQKTYFIAETEANGVVNNDAIWLPTNARTLSAAKQAATRMQMFQGTSLHVAEKDAAGEFHVVSVRRADAINMNKPGEWRNHASL